ncbi:YybH family protein [Parachitinimonas caeni]|uniref:DUF4440 domain-containing protein n=1 Tax=Parachitinimonas caeni TaxID=3031301 RepID=A0ABT7DUM2_9NEIS|nr:DUF4440 domain-containing protein [Parachitinimonas caeni]MDK2123765.1 DUF4440 domain-containing protein [Parachitinimonas caeni]
MPANSPADVHRLFSEYFSSGNLDGLVSLYEPDAVLLPQPGLRVTGQAGIREALAGFMGMNGRFVMAAPKIIEANGVALLYADWTFDATGPDGTPLQMAGQTSDVARRQADGSWLLAIDSPFGSHGL